MPAATKSKAKVKTPDAPEPELDRRGVLTMLNAMKRGEFTKRVPEGLTGLNGKVADALNDQADMNQTMASSIRSGKTRVRITRARRRGGWARKVEAVNEIAHELTQHANGIVSVIGAVAKGDLSQTISLDDRDEPIASDFLRHARIVNTMVEKLDNFGTEVTRVAREVGVDGKLGVQANVQDVSGALKNLTDNVNQMIATLSDSTAINKQQDRLKTNLAAFTRMLQGERNLASVAQKIISELARVLDAQHGAFYLSDFVDEEVELKLVASYAYRKRKTVANRFKLGAGLVGQAALEKQWIDVRAVPEDYIQINSGLGEKKPRNILVNPIIYEDEIKGVVELASFHEFTDIERSFLEQFFETLGTIIVSMESGQRTEELLKQSQSLTEELQNQQEDLQQTNEELEEKAREVSQQNEEVERKNAEVETARAELNDKARQLALTSKYKSEFLANLLHELRTPLNSLLILSQQLAEDPEENLSSKHIEHAETIFESGRDLLSLINEVLDLAKVETGTMAIDIAPIEVKELQNRLDQTFNAVTKEKGLEFEIKVKRHVPTSIKSDEKRMMQVLRNLLSNAMKFTQGGSVELVIDLVNSGWRPSFEALNQAKTVLAFQVTDTRIGIENDRLALIFEAFQQADGGTSRRYGGAKGQEVGQKRCSCR